MIALKHLSTSLGLKRRGDSLDGLPREERERLCMRGLAAEAAEAARGATQAKVRSEAKRASGARRGAHAREGEEGIALEIDAADCIM